MLLHNFHLGKKCAVALIGRMQKFLPAILLGLFYSIKTCLLRVVSWHRHISRQIEAILSLLVILSLDLWHLVKKGSHTHTQPSSSQLFSFQERAKKTIFQEIFIASNTLTRIKKSRRKMHRSLWARMYATFTAKVHNHSPLRRCHLSALINVEKVLLRISYITTKTRVT